MQPRGLAGTLAPVLIIILVAPTLASPVLATTTLGDPMKSSLASIASEPLGTAPLTLRRQAYEALLPIAGMLPPGMVDRILEDESLFADRARPTSALPLDHGRELIGELLKINRAAGAGTALWNASAQGVLLLLRAGRHSAALALSDANSAFGASGLRHGQVWSAIRRAGMRYDGAMSALGSGDAGSAARGFASSYALSAWALSLMGISYSPDADLKGEVWGAVHAVPPAAGIPGAGAV